jgi:hypothetical protein
LGKDCRQFPLQESHRFVSLSDVRWLSPALLVVLLLPRLCAQEQERKLIDRLLKPDLTLQNSAQNKKFVIRSTSEDRPLKPRRFFWQEKTITKSISDTRDFSPRSFYTRPFHNTKGVAGSLSAKTAPRSHLAFGTQTARGVRRAADGDKKVNGRDFAGNRPFLGQGKSQKALSTQDKPLTIEQVRELLNKNK